MSAITIKGKKQYFLMICIFCMLIINSGYILHNQNTEPVKKNLWLEAGDPLLMVFSDLQRETETSFKVEEGEKVNLFTLARYIREMVPPVCANESNIDQVSYLYMFTVQVIDEFESRGIDASFLYYNLDHLGVALKQVSDASPVVDETTTEDPGLIPQLVSNFPDVVEQPSTELEIEVVEPVVLAKSEVIAQVEVSETAEVVEETVPLVEVVVTEVQKNATVKTGEVEETIKEKTISVAKIQAVEEKTNEKLLSVKELTQQKIEALHTDKTMSVDAQFAGMLEFEESGDEIVESLDLDLGFLVE